MSEQTSERIIKRYQNRKLYDTEDSKYVTLDDIAKMIRQGQDIKVVDNASGKDLTSITLAQIIFELEKKQEPLMPLAMLKNLVRSGGESLSDIYETYIAPSLQSIHQTREELERNIRSLMKKGKLPEEEGTSLIHDMYSKTQRQLDSAQKHIESKVTEVVEVLKGKATLSQTVSKLEKQVAALEREIARLKASKD